jgi:hypothetical protein
MRILLVFATCLSLSAYGAANSPTCEELYPDYDCKTTKPSWSDFDPSTAFEKKPSFNPISGKNLLVGIGVVSLFIGAWMQKGMMSKRRADDPRSSATD